MKLVDRVLNLSSLSLDMTISCMRIFFFQPGTEMKNPPPTNTIKHTVVVVQAKTKLYSFLINTKEQIICDSVCQPELSANQPTTDTRAAGGEQLETGRLTQVQFRSHRPLPSSRPSSSTAPPEEAHTSLTGRSATSRSRGGSGTWGSKLLRRRQGDSSESKSVTLPGESPAGTGVLACGCDWAGAAGS